jgi:hypothetical protein
MAQHELRNRAEELQSQREKLATQLKEAEQHGIDLEERAIEYNVLVRNRDTTKKTYTQILDRLDEARISAQLKDTNLRLVDLAMPLESLHAQQASCGAAVSAFLFGLTCSASLPHALRGPAAAQGARRHRIHEAGDGGRRAKGRRSQRKSLANPAESSTDCPIGESFRAIYSSLKLTGDGASGSMMVTSTLPSEGKSVVAAHIAASFSRHDKRTLLPDCDFRRPCMHRMFGLDTARGPAVVCLERPVPNKARSSPIPTWASSAPARVSSCAAPAA